VALAQHCCSASCSEGFPLKAPRVPLSRVAGEGGERVARAGRGHARRSARARIGQGGDCGVGGAGRGGGTLGRGSGLHPICAPYSIGLAMLSVGACGFPILAGVPRSTMSTRSGTIHNDGYPRCRANAFQIAPKVALQHEGLSLIDDGVEARPVL
jgi:hypothetical protein